MVSLPGYARIGALLVANATCATLVTVWAQSTWQPLALNKPECLHGTLAGAVFAAATWLVDGQGTWKQRSLIVTAATTILAAVYLGLDRLYRQFADWRFGLDPLDTVVLIFTTFAITSLTEALIHATPRHAGGRFTIRHLLLWTVFVAVLFGALRLLVPTVVFAPVTEDLGERIIRALRWHVPFAFTGIWVLFPAACVLARQQHISQQAVAVVLAATLFSVATAFPLFSLLERYVNGFWSRPTLGHWLAFLVPFLTGFVPTAIMNLLAPRFGRR